MATINHTNANVPLGWPVTMGTQTRLQVLTLKTDSFPETLLWEPTLEPLFLGLSQLPHSLTRTLTSLTVFYPPHCLLQGHEPVRWLLGTELRSSGRAVWTLTAASCVFGPILETEVRPSGVLSKHFTYGAVLLAPLPTTTVLQPCLMAASSVCTCSDYQWLVSLLLPV